MIPHYFCCFEDIACDNKELILNNELQHVNYWLNANRLSLTLSNPWYFRQLSLKLLYTYHTCAFY